MKHPFWATFGIGIVFTMILAACAASPGTPPVPEESPAPPQTSNLSSPANAVVASARVLPKSHAEMGFSISAPVRDVLVKKGDIVQAGQLLMVLSTPDLELAVQEAEWAFVSAEALRNRARDPYKKVFSESKVLYAAGYVEKRNEMEARLEVSQAALDAAKYELARGRLLAPFDGVVVDISIEPGEFVQTGQVVITLADLDYMQVETTDLSERDVPNVQAGQTADVYIEALDITVTGRVIRVSPMPETVGGDVVYPVTIELDEQPEGLRWGMTAEVEIME